MKPEPIVGFEGPAWTTTFSTLVRPARALCILIVLIAFAVRAYHLDFQSLWSDEGISLQRSSQALTPLWQNMPVEHVPGYFVLLHFWLGWTGHSDYALRYLSLLPSVWAVALIYRLGVDLGSYRDRLAGGHAAGDRRVSGLVRPGNAHV